MFWRGLFSRFLSYTAYFCREVKRHDPIWVSEGWLFALSLSLAGLLHIPSIRNTE